MMSEVAYSVGDGAQVNAAAAQIVDTGMKLQKM